MSNKQQSIGKGFVILSMSSIIVKVISLFFVPIMRALLGGAAGYAIFGASNEVFAFVYVLATAGLPVAISKLITELTAKNDPRAAERAFKMARAILFVIGLTLAVLLAVFSKPIARWMNAEESWAGILCIAPTILICAMLSAYRGYSQGKKNMTPTAISQIAEQVVHVIVSVVMVLLLRPMGIVWAVAGASLGTVAGALVALVIVYRGHVMEERREYRRRLDVLRTGGRDALEAVMSPPSKDGKPSKRTTTKEIFRKIIFYSIPITLNAGIQYGGNMIDASILLGRLEHGGFAQEVSRSLYGDLLATRQLLNVPISIISALCVSVLPTLAALYAVKDRRQTSEKANYGFRLCYMVSVPMVAAFAIFAQPVYTLLGYGVNYNLLMALSFSVLLQGTVHLQSSILQSVNRLFTATGFLGISVILKAVLNYILVGIPSLNVYGAIISTYVSYIIPFFLNQYVLNQKLRMHISILGNLWRPSLAASFMVMLGMPAYFGLYHVMSLALPVYAATLCAFLVTVIISVGIYAYVLAKIGGITQYDLKNISPALGRRWPKKLRRIF